MIKKTLVLLAIGLGLMVYVTSCNVFDDDFEQPTPEEELQDRMPYAQYIIAYWQGLDMARYQLQWAQQLGGIRGIFNRIDTYAMESGDTDDIWYFYYSNIYIELKSIIAYAEESGSRAFRGIARILQAYCLGMMTDTWGDLPFSQANEYFAGTGFPAYDTQDIIYMEMFQLLEMGIADLRGADPAVGLFPGPDHDMIYGGDLDKWEKAANVIRLRYMLRMGNQGDDYSMALDNIQSRELFGSAHDDMVYHFDQSLNQENPHHYFDENRRHTRVGAYFVNMLKEQNDPRLPYFVKDNINGNYLGLEPGSINFNASFPAAAVASKDTPIKLISHTEQMFMEAEVYFRMGDQVQADMAFEEAVISSLRSFGIEDPEWEAEHASVENVTIEQIINAKYIALFLNPEVWSDYRRTGYPTLTPYGNDTLQGIPRRFLYPWREFNTNSDNVPHDVTLYTRMWWDVE